MTPVLTGLTVLDLSSGSGGPVAGMLLGDYGADVVKIEPPGGDPFRQCAAYTVWNRNRRSVVLDLAERGDRGVLVDLAGHGDVMPESGSPGTTAALGIDHATLVEHNPALMTSSITGYGRHGDVATRPGYDALVQAPSGMQWEQSGVASGTDLLARSAAQLGAPRCWR